MCSNIALLKIHRIIGLICITIFLVACDKTFEFSPYGANVNTKSKATTKKNLQLIKDIQLDSDTFSFAVITDSHFYYNNLRTVINDINKNDDIEFVIIAGDITHQALLKEYEIFYDIMKNCNKPYFTVIGNHDYLSNGKIVYEQMFGDTNYSFEFNHNRFVFFDNVVWESNKNPDFAWLSTQLADNALFKQVFVIAHMPPSSYQFDSELEQTFKEILQENNVQLSINGHVHRYSFSKVYHDDVNYLTVPCLEEPTYCIIEVQNETFDIELIEL